MEQLQSTIESIPGFDIAQGYLDDKASELYNSNPYQDKNGHRLRLPADICTKQDQKTWKKIQSQAWKHDKCFLGSCGIGLDCGLGLAPLVTIIPGIGPLLMYIVHQRLISIAEKSYEIPPSLIAKMESQILFDLLITLPPLIGIFTSWINSCSTRNANAIYKHIVKSSKARAQRPPTTYVRTPQPVYTSRNIQQPPYNASNNQVSRSIPDDRSQEMGYV